MSTPLLFKLTAAGQAAAWNASNTGLQVAITHVQLGSAPRPPSGQETALTTPAQLSPIAAGSRVSPSQIRLSAMFSGAQTYPIHEIGLWAGEPGTSGAVLFAYYAQATPIAHKSPGVDFIFTHDMALADAVASGSVTITTDPAASAMLALLEAHQQATDPHVRYAPLASPALTGTPTAPTATAGTNTTQIATTEFVQLSSPASLTSSGYQKLPSGLIIQWGATSVTMPTTNKLYGTIVTFPIAFPRGCLTANSTPSNIHVTHINTSSESLGTSSFNLVTSTGTGSNAAMAVRWIAIGY